VVHEFDQRGLPQGKICFEVTETVAIANLINAQQIFSRLAEMGCLFSLDDFGTGMSSYGYLKNLPVDFVKIDGVFVRTLTEDNIDAKLVESITDIAHEMGIRSIAEYVENEQIMARLKAIGVDYAQGYFIGEPKSLDSLRLPRHLALDPGLDIGQNLLRIAAAGLDHRADGDPNGARILDHRLATGTTG